MPAPRQRPRKSPNPFHGTLSVFKSGKRAIDAARDNLPGSLAANDRYEKGGDK